MSISTTIAGLGRYRLATAGAFACTMFAGAAGAAQPQNWQIGLQPAASPMMEEAAFFHDWILFPIITVITLFVLGLLLYAMWRFNAKRNPVPSRTTHSTVLEVAWTAVPVLILMGIAIPSFRLLYNQERMDNIEMTVKVVSYQWYWGYQYPDHGGFVFDSRMIPDNEIKPGQLRKLEVDNRLVLPVNTKIRFLVTSQDVLHNFAVPSLNMKLDTVPGRVNETWTLAKEVGVYYGQCSELCGVDHANMPIAIEVVTKEQFAAWTEQAKKKFAGAQAPQMQPQQAQPLPTALATLPSMPTGLKAVAQ